MTTRDGVILVSDLYHPMRAAGMPTILVRIPFSKTILNSLFATVVGRFWAERGYTVVIQGTRGRYESGGRHYPLLHEREDGLDTLEWLQRQPWFDGRLGMWGGSAFGYTQWAIADHLPVLPTGRSALIVQICSTDFYDMFYPGGAFSLSSALFWAVRSRGAEDESPEPETLERGVNGFPVIDADDRAVGGIGFFDDWAKHPTRDAYWREIDGEGRSTTLQAPVLLMAGWFDPFLPGQLADFVRIRRNARADVAAATRLVVGPWAHAETIPLPGDVRNRNYRLESLAPSLPWFDRHLRSLGPGVQADAPVPTVRDGCEHLARRAGMAAGTSTRDVVVPAQRRSRKQRQRRWSSHHRGSWRKRRTRYVPVRSAESSADWRWRNAGLWRGRLSSERGGIAK